jgi:hypothetical protein
MERGIDVLGVRGNDKSQILPVIEVCGFVASDSPVPNLLGRICKLLILAVPIIDSVKIHYRAAMCLYAFSLGIKPYLTGTEAVISIAHFSAFLSVICLQQVYKYAFRPLSARI